MGGRDPRPPTQLAGLGRLLLLQKARDSPVVYISRPGRSGLSQGEKDNIKVTNPAWDGPHPAIESAQVAQQNTPLPETDSLRMGRTHGTGKVESDTMIDDLWKSLHIACTCSRRTCIEVLMVLGNNEAIFFYLWIDITNAIILL